MTPERPKSSDEKSPSEADTASFSLDVHAAGLPSPVPARAAGLRGALDHGQFQPGEVLAGRYRISGLLGRGGMGEVYRADDLRLGQPVALKFIAQRTGTDAARLAQLHQEVAIARQVSHPHVCRVYDIGESGKRIFLSMEFVDGEDLAASLRRLGRPSEDRAIEIARQLCAGLMAAHERGVIHRDLKPANIMLDGTGTVRIMDFGIATLAEHAHGLAGTPAYMAPEQLLGGASTTESDIYALGLVLYELFTGKRATLSDAVGDIVQQRASGVIRPPSELVPAMDPAVERAILACLNRQPALRPSSALAVSALLPGGDPLAAALAAGDTPSPEMVAAAGTRDAALTGAQAALWIAALALLLALAGLMADRATVAGQSGMRKPAAVLAEYARQIRALSHTERAAPHEAQGFEYDPDALRWYAARGGARAHWQALTLNTLPAVRFWFRSSESGLDPLSPVGLVTLVDPPPTSPGDTVVELDTQARLLRFFEMPPLVMPPDAAPRSPDWPAFFKAAGLDMAAFTAAVPARTPPTFADARFAWQGPVPEWPDQVLRIEAASLSGRPVSFVLVAPWTAGAAPPQQGIAGFLATVVSAGISVVLVISAIWLAITNVLAARTDRRGAYRVAVFAFLVQVVRWVLQPAHSSDPITEGFRLYMGLGFGLLFAFVIGGAYLGLEPFVRRYWPRALIGWTRLVAGRLHDPIVGRDLLVGATVGLCSPAILLSYQLIPRMLGWPSPAGWLAPLAPAAGLGSTLPFLAYTVDWSLVNGLYGMFIVVAIRRVVTPLWAAAALSMLVFSVLGDPATTIDFGRPTLLAVLYLQTLPLIIVLVRCGLLAGVAAALSSNLVTNMVFTLDPSRGYFHASLLQVGLIMAIGWVGWLLARGRRPARNA